MKFNGVTGCTTKTDKRMIRSGSPRGSLERLPPGSSQAANVDDVLWTNLTCLSNLLIERFELSEAIVGEGHDQEVGYFDRFVFWNSGAVTILGGSPHSDSLTKEGEHGTAYVVLARLCPGKGMERACWSELLDESAMSMARAIARMHDVASDRVVLSRKGRVTFAMLVRTKTA